MIILHGFSNASFTSWPVILLSFLFFIPHPRLINLSRYYKAQISIALISILFRLFSFRLCGVPLSINTFDVVFSPFHLLQHSCATISAPLPRKIVKFNFSMAKGKTYELAHLLCYLVKRISSTETLGRQIETEYRKKEEMTKPTTKKPEFVKGECTMRKSKPIDVFY